MSRIKFLFLLTGTKMVKFRIDDCRANETQEKEVAKWIERKKTAVFQSFKRLDRMWLQCDLTYATIWRGARRTVGHRCCTSTRRQWKRYRRPSGSARSECMMIASSKDSSTAFSSTLFSSKKVLTPAADWALQAPIEAWMSSSLSYIMLNMIDIKRGIWIFIDLIFIINTNVSFYY